MTGIPIGPILAEFVAKVEAVENFTPAERARLAPHFSNVDGPVFALVGLPETVKAAMFARYSRYPGTLRRLFLDEFADSLPEGAAAGTDVEGSRASELFERVFVGYGDDSVAQLGGAHIACEWVSNVLTKVLQRPRLAGYLEQSTRYIAYDAPMPGGGYRYYRDESLGAEYAAAMDLLFDTYAAVAAARERVGGFDVSGVARRVRGGPPARGQGQGAGPAARAAARRVAVAHGHLRERPGVRAADPAPARAPAAGGAALRRADAGSGQGRDAELRRARRALRPRRRLDRLPERAPGGRAALGVAARAGP